MDPGLVIPRDAIYDPVKHDYIVAYEYPSAIFIIPLVLFFYFFMMMITDNGERRLRETIFLKKNIKDFKKSLHNKLTEGIQLYHEWKDNKFKKKRNN